VRLFIDCAQIDVIESVSDQVHGITTNPTILRAAGVTDYLSFAKELVRRFPWHSISLEVIADDIDTMYSQANTLAALGPSVFVKIPVMCTNGTTTLDLVDKLTSDGTHVNVTAVMTATQVYDFNAAMADRTECYLSIFAGRIADTGRDPTFLVGQAVADAPENVSILWASTREVYNVKQAHDCGADIITLTPDLLAKYGKFGYDLDEFSLDTCKMFRLDALAAGLTL
jgi:transaldolase